MSLVSSVDYEFSQTALLASQLEEKVVQGFPNMILFNQHKI